MVVFFDVGGTLLDVSPSIGHVYAGACAERGARVEPSDIQIAFDNAWVALSAEVPRGADRYSMLPGGEEEWWERISSKAFELCGVAAEHRPAVADLRAMFARREAWRIYPETRAVLKGLQARGLRLGVISNWDSRLPALLASLDLSAHFETLVYSAAAGFEKPHPAIFKSALAAFGVDPAHAVHVGDRLEEDYAGARAAGLNALLVRREPVGPDLRDGVRLWGDERDLVADLSAAGERIMELAAR